MIKSIAIVLLITSCSTLIQKPSGASVTCRTVDEPCPETADVDAMLRAYDAEFGFDWHAPLAVSWFDRTHVFWINENGRDVIGFTSNPDSVSVTSCRVLMHELRHADLWRETGDPDHNHEERPGPWIVGDDDRIRAIELKACPTSEFPK